MAAADPLIDQLDKDIQTAGTAKPAPKKVAPVSDPLIDQLDKDIQQQSARKPTSGPPVLSNAAEAKIPPPPTSVPVPGQPSQVVQQPTAALAPPTRQTYKAPPARKLPTVAFTPTPEEQSYSQAAHAAKALPAYVKSAYGPGTFIRGQRDMALAQLSGKFPQMYMELEDALSSLSPKGAPVAAHPGEKQVTLDQAISRLRQQNKKTPTPQLTSIINRYDQINRWQKQYEQLAKDKARTPIHTGEYYPQELDKEPGLLVNFGNWLAKGVMGFIAPAQLSAAENADPILAAMQVQGKVPMLPAPTTPYGHTGAGVERAIKEKNDVLLHYQSQLQEPTEAGRKVAEQEFWKRATPWQKKLAPIIRRQVGARIAATELAGGGKARNIDVAMFGVNELLAHLVPAQLIEQAVGRGLTRNVVTRIITDVLARGTSKLAPSISEAALREWMNAAAAAALTHHATGYTAGGIIGTGSALYQGANLPEALKQGQETARDFGKLSAAMAVGGHALGLRGVAKPKVGERIPKPTVPAEPPIATAGEHAGARYTYEGKTVPVRSHSPEVHSNTVNALNAKEASGIPLTPEETHARVLSQAHLNNVNDYHAAHTINFPDEKTAAQHKNKWNDLKTPEKQQYNVLTKAANEAKDAEVKHLLQTAASDAQRNFNFNYRRTLQERNKIPLIEEGIPNDATPPNISAWRHLTEEQRAGLSPEVKKVLLLQDIDNSNRVIDPTRDSKTYGTKKEVASVKNLQARADALYDKAQQAYQEKLEAGAPKLAPAEPPPAAPPVAEGMGKHDVVPVAPAVEAPAEDLKAAQKAASEAITAAKKAKVEGAANAVELAQKAQAAAKRVKELQAKPKETAAPVAEQQRVHTALREQIDRLSPEEKDQVIKDLRNKVTVDEKTGLGTAAAYLAADKKPVQARLDADGLKYINDNFGHDAGDDLIKALGDALKKAGLEKDSYHISGDEFTIQGENAKDLKAKLEQAKTILNEGVSVKDTEGNTRTFKGLGFSYGIGEHSDYNIAGRTAEKNLKAAKAEALAKGLRPGGRGEKPFAVHEDIPLEKEKNEIAAAQRAYLDAVEEHQTFIHPEVEKLKAKVDKLKEQLQKAQEVPPPPHPEAVAPVIPAFPEAALGRRYHGSSSPVDLGFAYDREQYQNLYGPGFYTTDNIAIGHSYTKKGRGTEPSFYEVKWVGEKPPNLLNLEKPLPAELQKIFQDEYSTYLTDKLDFSKPGKEIYRDLKDAMAYEGLTVDEAQEVMHDIADALHAKGYDGFAHIGGKGDKTKHNVEIYFHPKDPVTGKPNIELTRVSAEKIPIPASPEQTPVVAKPKQSVIPPALAKLLDEAHGHVVRRRDINILRTSELRAYLDRIEDVVHEASKPETLDDIISREGEPLSSGDVDKAKIYLQKARKALDSGDTVNVLLAGEQTLQTLHPLGYWPKESPLADIAPLTVSKESAKKKVTTKENILDTKPDPAAGIPPTLAAPDLREQIIEHKPVEIPVGSQYRSRMTDRIIEVVGPGDKEGFVKIKVVDPGRTRTVAGALYDVKVTTLSEDFSRIPKGMKPGFAFLGKKTQGGWGPFLEPESEKLFNEHKVPDNTWRDWLEERGKKLTTFGHRLTRMFEGVAHTAENRPFIEAAKQAEVAPSLAHIRTYMALNDEIRGLDRGEFKSFERALYYLDLEHTIYDQANAYEKLHGTTAGFEPTLPDGITHSSVIKEVMKIKDNMKVGDPVTEALLHLKDARKFVGEYEDAWEAVSGRKLNLTKNTAFYFRHQVIAQELGRESIGGARKVRLTPVPSPAQKRNGTTLPHSTDFVKAELDAGTQLAKKTIYLKLLKVAQDNHDISHDVKLSQIELNKPEVVETLQAAAAGDLTKLTPVAVSRLGDLAVEEHLPDRLDQKFAPLINALQDYRNDFVNRMGAGQPTLPITADMQAQLKEYGKWITSRRNEKGRLKGAGIPKGYVKYELTDRSPLYTGLGIDEQVFNDAQQQAVSNILGIPVEAVKKKLMVGRRPTALVLPEGIAKALKDLETPFDHSIKGGFDRTIRFINQKTKWLDIFNSARSAVAFRNKLVRDADALFQANASMVPKVVPRALQAGKYALQLIRGQEVPETFRTFVEDGGLSGGFMSRSGIELALELRRAGYEEDAIKKAMMVGKKAQTLTQLIMQFPHDVPDILIKYGTYEQLLQEMKSNAQGMPSTFGASDYRQVMALPRLEDRARMITNQLFVAHNESPVMVKFLRDYLAPFFGLRVGVAKRDWGIFKNAWDVPEYAYQIGTKISKGKLYGYRAYALGRYITKTVGPYAGLMYLNNLYHHDAEEQMSIEERLEPHLTLGYDPKTGKATKIAIPLNLFETAHLLGMDKIGHYWTDMHKGKMTLADAVKEAGDTLATNAFEELSPVYRVLGTLLARKVRYPSFMKPRTLKDPYEYAFKEVGLDGLYRWYNGLPGDQSLIGETQKLFKGDKRSKEYFLKLFTTIKTQDLGDEQYNAARTDFNNWLEKTGRTEDVAEVDSFSPKAMALYHARRAAGLGDREAQNQFIMKAASEDGLKGDDLIDSFLKLDPLHGIPATQPLVVINYLKGLDDEDKSVVVRGYLRYLDRYATKVDPKEVEGMIHDYNEESKSIDKDIKKGKLSGDDIKERKTNNLFNFIVNTRALATGSFAQQFAPIATAEPVIQKGIEKELLKTGVK